MVPHGCFASRLESTDVHLPLLRDDAIHYGRIHPPLGLGETLATTLVASSTRVVAKICAYTYAFLINRILGRSEGCIEELWA
jgi:hypothetical protein